SYLDRYDWNKGRCSRLLMRVSSASRMRAPRANAAQKPILSALPSRGKLRARAPDISEDQERKAAEPEPCFVPAREDCPLLVVHGGRIAPRDLRGLIAHRRGRRPIGWSVGGRGTSGPQGRRGGPRGNGSSPRSATLRASRIDAPP